MDNIKTIGTVSPSTKLVTYSATYGKKKTNLRNANTCVVKEFFSSRYHLSSFIKSVTCASLSITFNIKIM